MTEEAAILEMPSMPPPSFAPMFCVLSYYVGPGRSTKSWKLHRDHFMSEAAAKLYADKLERWHLHRRIVRIG